MVLEFYKYWCVEQFLVVGTCLVSHLVLFSICLPVTVTLHCCYKADNSGTERGLYFGAVVSARPGLTLWVWHPEDVHVHHTKCALQCIP